MEIHVLHVLSELRFDRPLHDWTVKLVNQQGDWVIYRSGFSTMDAGSWDSGGRVAVIGKGGGS